MHGCQCQLTPPLGQSPGGCLPIGSRVVFVVVYSDETDPDDPISECTILMHVSILGNSTRAYVGLDGAIPFCIFVWFEFK